VTDTARLLEEARARAAWLRNREPISDSLVSVALLLDQCAAELQRLREALGFYADKRNYDTSGVLWDVHTDDGEVHEWFDKGSRARAALAGATADREEET
jgi:hypothetical protein